MSSHHRARPHHHGAGRSSRLDAMPESRLNLLVRYLDHGVNDDQLRGFFLRFGDVTSSMVMRDILTGESRGFGFVRFARSMDAARALAEADGKKIGSKAVNVIWAKQQHDTAPAGQDRLKMNKLFLRNVPADVTETQLVDLIGRCGVITDVSLHNDKIAAACCTTSRRIAFVVFSTEGAAEAALHLVHNTCPFPSCCGVPLMAKLSEDYKAKPSAPVAAAPTHARVLAGDAAPQPSVSPLRSISEVPPLLALAEGGCQVSTPNSANGRSPGVSSLVTSHESVGFEPSVSSHVRPLISAEVEGSLHPSHVAARTPVRRISADATVYRHNPYGSALLMTSTAAWTPTRAGTESMTASAASLLW